MAEDATSFKMQKLNASPWEGIHHTNKREGRRADGEVITTTTRINYPLFAVTENPGEDDDLFEDELDEQEVNEFNHFVDPDKFDVKEICEVADPQPLPEDDIEALSAKFIFRGVSRGVVDIGQRMDSPVDLSLAFKVWSDTMKLPISTPNDRATERARSTAVTSKAHAIVSKPRCIRTDETSGALDARNGILGAWGPTRIKGRENLATNVLGQKAYTMVIITKKGVNEQQDYAANKMGVLGSAKPKELPKKNSGRTVYQHERINTDEGRRLTEIFDEQTVYIVRERIKFPSYTTNLGEDVGKFVFHACEAFIKTDPTLSWVPFLAHSGEASVVMGMAIKDLYGATPEILGVFSFPAHPSVGKYTFGVRRNEGLYKMGHMADFALNFGVNARGGTVPEWERSSIRRDCLARKSGKDDRGRDHFDYYLTQERGKEKARLRAGGRPYSYREIDASLRNWAISHELMSPNLDLDATAAPEDRSKTILGYACHRKSALLIQRYTKEGWAARNKKISDSWAGKSADERARINKQRQDTRRERCETYWPDDPTHEFKESGKRGVKTRSKKVATLWTGARIDKNKLEWQVFSNFRSVPWTAISPDVDEPAADTAAVLDPEGRFMCFRNSVWQRLNSRTQQGQTSGVNVDREMWFCGELGLPYLRGRIETTDSSTISLGTAWNTFDCTLCGRPAFTTFTALVNSHTPHSTCLLRGCTIKAGDQIKTGGKKEVSRARVQAEQAVLVGQHLECVPFQQRSVRVWFPDKGGRFVWKVKDSRVPTFEKQLGMFV